MSKPKKEDFFEFFEPKWKRLIKRCVPVSWLIRYNKWCYDHDALLFRLENIVDSLQDLVPYYKVKWWLSKHFGGMFRNRIPQAWAFAKYGWYDGDWDYHYLLDLIEFKLVRMQDCINTHSRHIGYEDTVLQIQIARSCLERFKEDIFLSEMYERIDELYPDKYGVDDLLGKRGRKIWLDKNGKKNVVYETSRKRPEGYSQTFKELNEYYTNLRLAEFRVFVHIITPGNYNSQELKEIKEYNQKMYDKYGDDYDKHCKYVHHGLLRWWD